MNTLSIEVLWSLGCVLILVACVCRMKYLERTEGKLRDFSSEDSVILNLTHRGFQKIEFRDAYGIQCSLQQSSAIDSLPRSELKPGSSFVWLGIDSPQPRIMKSAAVAKGLDVGPGEVSGWMNYPIPNDVFLSGRMHLDKKKAEMLVKHLSRWIETGELE